MKKCDFLFPQTQRLLCVLGNYKIFAIWEEIPRLRHYAVVRSDGNDYVTFETLRSALGYANWRTDYPKRSSLTSTD